ncbi:hypothetical protein ZOSMA_3G01420 [Zostera marina]|uniref:Uncharacterized protein n=1 Tax=Zostera marina TaxID=29655 RepID=A0A0K9P659_ZOSMR|nr:hypothetical protein ZOSMA_3G01420 [Zostera marina]
MSSLSIRRSPSLNSVTLLGKCRLVSPSSISVAPLCLTPLPTSSVDVTSVSSKVSFTHGSGRPPTPDAWLKRSALLRRMLSDYTYTEIGVTLRPLTSDTRYYHTLEERDRLLQSSPFPLRTMEDVIADVSHSRVHTHTFFSTEAVPRSPLSAPAPLSPVPPLMSSIVATPPVESYFTLLSMLPNAPTSMPVQPFMHSALSSGRLYRSSSFVRELGATNAEWNLAHSHPFQSLAFGAFSQALNSTTLLHAMYIASYEATSRLQALENDKFSLTSQVSHLSFMNEQLLSEL